MLPVGGIGQHGKNILGGQFRKIILNFLRGHPVGQHRQNVMHRDTQPADAGPAATIGI